MLWKGRMDNASPSEPEARMRHYRIGTSSTGFVAADPAANALETASGLESRSLIALKSGVLVDAGVLGGLRVALTAQDNRRACKFSRSVPLAALVFLSTRASLLTPSAAGGAATTSRS
jgi:hypothetical protein